MVGHSLPKAMANKLIGAGASTGSVAMRNAMEKSMAFSASLSSTAPRVRSLQRDCLRSVPWIKRAYGIRLSEASMRAAITGKFKDKMNGTDVHTVNRLIIMGRMELEETLMLWKGASHVANWFDNAVEAEKAKAAPPPSFLADFLAGK